MILILSRNNDLTTYQVMKWIAYQNREVMLLTESDKVREISISGKQTILRFEDKTLDLADVRAYWYRRGDLDLSSVPAGTDYPPIITDHIRQEVQHVNELIYSRLADIPHLGTFKNRNLNRLVIFDHARIAGFLIPAFGIFNTRTQVQQFISTHGKTVTKPISNGILETEDLVTYAQYTTLFEPADAAALTDTFVPALFAAYVEKKYELRIFYLAGVCYTMAILSQQDPQTAVDMRNYNYRKPNRNLPYQLPKTIEEKIDALMRSLQLVTGSIDMIVTPDDEFVFLEINPAGQFGNVSSSCNYHLEKKVADHLIRIASAPDL